MRNDKNTSDRLLLLVEDNDADFEAMANLLKKAGVRIPIRRCVNGDDALDYLYRRDVWQQGAIRPTLVLLDLNLPGTDGRTVLATIKADESLKAIPVLVLSASPHQDDIVSSYRAGANSYLMKPDNLQEFGELVQAIKQYWLGKYLALDGQEVAMA